MENSSLVNYLSEWPLNLLSGIIAGVGVVILMAAVRLMLDMEAVQFGLMALIAVSVSIFAYARVTASHCSRPLICRHRASAPRLGPPQPFLATRFSR